MGDRKGLEIGNSVVRKSRQYTIECLVNECWEEGLWLHRKGLVGREEGRRESGSGRGKQ